MLGKSARACVCAVLAASMFFSGLAGVTTRAAVKAKLKKKKISMTVGQKKKITIAGKKQKAVYSFTSSSRARATVSKKGVIKAKKAGKVTIKVKEKYKKKTRSLGKVTVQIKKKGKTADVTAVPSASTVPTSAPGGTTTTAAPVQTATVPTGTPVPTAVPTPTIKPIKQYVEDTDFSVPVGFMDVDKDVEGTVEDISYESTAIKEGVTVTRKAKVVLPKGYTEEKKYPVVYMQHGIGGNETSLYGDKVQNVVWNAIANGDAVEMIVVFPNACANETGSSAGLAFHSKEHYEAYDNFVNDLRDCLIPYINENYSTATGRENTAVCGFSMGGRVSLHCGFTLQDTFRYIGAFCPAPGVLENDMNGVHEDGLFTPETFTLQDQYMNDTLVQITAGTNDGVVLDNPKKYSDTLEANGVPHIYYETKGGDANKAGGGGHEAAVYKHGLYNFLRRSFHLYD